MAGTQVIQGFFQGKDINFCEICIILYHYIDFYIFFSYGTTFYIRTFILVNQRNRQKNNIYIYIYDIFLHLIFDHVTTSPIQN